MGRAERRRLERSQRIEKRKNGVLVSRSDYNELKRTIVDTSAKRDVEVMMTCFALAQHRLYGFGAKRILRTLRYVDELMGEIVDDRKTIEDFEKELENETGLRICFD